MNDTETKIDLTMKKSIIGLVLIVSVCVNGTGCSKQEIRREDPPAGQTPSSEGYETDYRFFRNGLSSVDIGEARKVLLDFRNFNNGINAKVLTNLEGKRQDYRNELASHIGVGFKEQEKARNILETFLNELTEASKNPSAGAFAREGKIGIVQVSHDEQRLVNEKGVELGQVIQKMMIGALQVANIEHFLMKSLEADNQAVMEGGNSTAMEHYWDIAWGYLGSINADPDRISPLFLANYIEKEAVGMKGLENINVAVYHAFQAGRKAIVGNRTDEVRKQVGEIRGLLSKMLVLRTMFYLNESSKILRQKSGNELNEQYFHHMGEALGFILALPFVKNANGEYFITMDQAKELYDALTQGEKGIWDKERIEGNQAGSIIEVNKKIKAYYHI